MNIASPLHSRTHIRLFVAQNTLSAGFSPAFSSVNNTGGYRACPCHSVVENNRDAITALARSDKGLNNTVRASLAQAQQIDWSGNAADMYRKSLQTFAAVMDAHDCDATTAARLAQGSTS